MTMSIFRAEWQKILNHKWLVGFTIWIWPLGVIGVFPIFALLIGLGSVNDSSILGIPWTDQALFTWGNPGMFMGQLMLAAFAATVFAGESIWQTWKSIVPRQQRYRLLLAKYAVILLLIFITFNLMAFFAAIGSQVIAAIGGLPGSPDLFSDEAATFVGTYLRLVLTTFLDVTMVVIYTAIAAMLLRSVIGAVIGAVIAVSVDKLLVIILGGLAQLLNIPDLVKLHYITPSYHLQNIYSWLENGVGFSQFPELYEPTSLIISIGVFTLWLVGTLLLSLWIFARRDVG